MNTGTSLKNLVTLHGLGITVQSINTWIPKFTILDNHGDREYLVEYEGGHRGSVLKECKYTNDYVLVD